MQRYEPVRDLEATIVCYNRDKVSNHTDDQVARDCMRHTVWEEACHEPLKMTQQHSLEQEANR